MSSSTTQQQASTQPVPSQPDQAGDLLEHVLKLVGILALILLVLPLVIPGLVVAFMGGIAATKTFYWVTVKWWPAVITAGILTVTALYTVEAFLLTEWIRTGAAAGFFDRPISDWAPALWPTFWPYVIGNLTAGLFLVPAALSWQRRRTARQVQARRVPDVLTQERIEAAQKRAADWSTARQMGVKVSMVTGQITGRRPNGLTVPHPVGAGHAFGLVNRVTIRTFQDRFRDLRRVRDWIDPSGRFLVMPPTASAVRALVIAESGTGKTVLLNGLIHCALAAGWPIFMIDAKGDPADAAELVAQARTAGRTAAAGGPWNMFNGTPDQVTDKLMRLMPAADGANQHYLDEVRGILGMIQTHSPITSITDLRTRLTNPAPHVRDDHDLKVIGQIVDSRSGLTAGDRVLHALTTALRPLEPWISPDGWSYRAPHADVTVMPLSPVDTTQARIGDLLMVDLRHYMASRLTAGNKTPVLVIVDEFPQLVTADSDPGDTASSLFETARSAGMGLILAAQSTAGLSNDQTRRARALASGAALIIGRSKDPEDVVRYAGTLMRMEASGAAQGEELRSARAQHSYVIPPQDVREAWDGSFWLIQGGAIAPFRSLPPAPGTSITEDAGADVSDRMVSQHSPATTMLRHNTEREPAAAGAYDDAVLEEHQGGAPAAPVDPGVTEMPAPPANLPPRRGTSTKPSFTPPPRTPRLK